MSKRHRNRWAAAFLSSTIAVSSAGASPQLYGAVKELWVNDSGHSNVAYILVGETTFLSPCGSPSGYMVIDFSEAGMKEAYAMALSAFMSERNVRIAGVGACYGQHEKLKYMYLAQ